jgi:hypothetical protein
VNFACGKLRIGRQIRFREVQALEDFAVFEVQPDDAQPFAIIARRPKTERAAIGFQPACVVAPFKSAEEAIEALTRWASAPVPPPLLPPKPRAPSNRRNGNRSKPQPEATNQMFFDL